MANLLFIAQQTMDLYYQDLKSDNQFLAIEHFMLQCTYSYSKLMMDQWKENRLLAMQASGFTAVEMSNDWSREIILTVKLQKGCKDKWEACLPDNIFSFDYDARSSGLIAVFPVNCDCQEFIKIAVGDLWQLSIMPFLGKTYYYMAGKNKVIFTKPSCALTDKEVRILYIPAIDAQNKDAYIPDAMALLIINTALQVMLGAKNGVVVKKSDDQNPNMTLETEINQDLINK